MATLNLEVIFAAKDKITGPLKAIIGGSNDLSKAFKQTSSDLKSLQDQQRKIGRFTELQEGLAKTNAALDKHKQTIQELKQQAKLGPLTQEQVKALSGAEAAVKRLTATYKNQSQEITATAQDLNKAGLSVNQLADHESELKHKIMLTTMELNKRRDAMDKAAKAQERMAKTQAILQKGADMAKTGLAVSAVGAAGLGYTLKQYEDAEDAAMNLRVSMMQSGGKVAGEFNDINKLANTLGTKLPGTTAQFQNMMAVLVQQGVSAKAILGGVGEAAGYLGVQMKMPFEDAAEFAAKMQDATKTAEKDMLSLMDTIQRSYYLGVDHTNMLQGFSKLSDGMKTIKMEGLAGAKAMAPLLVMADQASMAGESAGNAYSKIFKAMMDTEKVQKALKDSKTGISMNFTDGKGEFGGLDKMYKQLEKLKGLSTEKRLPILADMFGNDAETIQALNLLIDKGQAGYNETVAKMQKQADLQTRVNAQLSTLKNLKDAAAGTFTSLLALFGEQLAPQFKVLITGFTNVTESVSTWAQQNPGLANTIAKVVAGGVLLIGGVSALALGIATVLAPLALLKVTLGALGGGLTLISGVFKLLLFPVKMLGTSIFWLGRTMLMAGQFMMANPIILAVTLLATAAFLIYRNWGPISEFFRGIWGSIQTIFAPIGAWFSTKMAEVKTAFSGGITGISSLIINWSPLGLFYSAFAGVLSWFGVDLPAKFTGFGAMILDGLKNGIMSRISAVTEAISGASQAVIAKAKGVLGIHSPSRVFMGLGGYTMQGLANGISNTQGLAQTATANAAGGVASAFKPQFKSASLPSFGQAGTFSQQRGVTFNNNDKIEIHIDASGKGPLHNAANEVRKALEERERERMAIQRRMLSDRE